MATLENSIRVGLNAYEVRFLIDEDMQGNFTKLKKIGFKNFEPALCIGKTFDNPKYPNLIWHTYDFLEKYECLREIGFEIPSAHVYYSEMDADLFAKDILYYYEHFHIRYFVFANYLLSEKEEADKLIHAMNHIAKQMPEEVQICYHNHEKELMTRVNDQNLLDYMLESCPGLMLEVDTGWLQYGNVDPVQFLDEHKDKTLILHFKDLFRDYENMDRKTMTCAIGKGIVDHETIIQNMKSYALAEDCPIIIDQDNSNTNMLEDLEIGLSYIEEKMQ